VLSRVEVASPDDVQAVDEQRRSNTEMNFQHDSIDAMEGEAPEVGIEPQQPVVRNGPKVGRNDPCPCGSGKKYKHCHGVLT